MRLSDINPLAKLIYSFLLISYITFYVDLSRVAIGVAVSLLILTLGRVNVKSFLKALVAASPFILGLAWFNTFISVYGGGSWTLGVVVALRGLAIVAVSVSFALSTDPDDFAISMVRNARVPYQFAFSLAIAYMMLMRMFQFYYDRVLALKARWLISREYQVLLHLKSTMVFAIATVARWSESLALSMELRGFTYGERTYWRDIEFRLSDVAFLATVAVILALSSMLKLSIYPFP